MNVKLRPTSDNDWPGILQVANQSAPWALAENPAWLRNRQQFNEQRYTRRQYVAEDLNTQQIVGYGAVEGGDTAHKYRVYVVTRPELLRELGGKIYQRLAADLTQLQAVVAWAREEAGDPLVAFFLERDFRETQRFTLPNGREAVVLERQWR